MANKPTKPIKVVPPATPTKDELEMKRLAYFAQRREGIAVNILTSLCRGNGFAYPKDQDNFGQLVDLSVEMADRLIQKLYPVTREDKK